MFVLPLSYITAAFARCTAGCAGLDGAQALHNLAGVAEYLGGTIALAIAGSAFLRQRRVVLAVGLWVAAIGVLLCFLAMTAPQYFEYRGAAQRLAETALFAFLVFLAWHPKPQICESVGSVHR
jgi:Na+/phosphate symporter